MAQEAEVSSDKVIVSGPASKVTSKKSAVSGSRRIFPAIFKIMVLDSYRTDKDCIGNQRATARKYGIHRRQIQKWLQCEQDLRKSCAKFTSNSNSSVLNLSLKLQEVPPIPKENPQNSENERVSPDSTSFDSSRPELIDTGPKKSGESCSSNTKFSSIRQLIGEEEGECNKIGSTSDFSPKETFNGNSIGNRIGPPSDLPKFQGKPQESSIVSSISNGVGVIVPGQDYTKFEGKPTENFNVIGSSQDFTKFSPNGQESSIVQSISNRIASPSDLSTFSPKPSENLIGNSIINVSPQDFTRFSPNGQESSIVQSISNGIGSPSDLSTFSPKPSETLIGNSIINVSPPDFTRFSPKSQDLRSPSDFSPNSKEAFNGIGSGQDYTRFLPNIPENLFGSITIRPNYIPYSLPIDYNYNLTLPSPQLNSVSKIMDLESESIQNESDLDCTSEDLSDSDQDPMDCSLELPSPEVTRRRSFPLAFKLRVLDTYYNKNMNQRATARRFNINRRQVQKWLAQETELRQEVSLRQGQGRQRLAATEPAPMDLRTCGFQDRPLCLVMPKIELPKPKKDYISFKPYLDNPVVKPDEQPTDNNCFCFQLPQWRYTYYESPSAFVRYPVYYM